jgi:uncharacterized protein DUF4231
MYFGVKGQQEETLAEHCAVNPPSDEREMEAWRATEKEWRRQVDETNDLLNWWRLTATLPPASAAVATVLAAMSIAKWAVIPAAVATASSGALAAFSFRSNFAEHKDQAEAIAFEATAFAVRAGEYAGDSQKRIDLLVGNVRAIVTGGDRQPTT